MISRKLKTLLIILLVSGFLMSACNSSTVRVGWVCLNSSNELSCKYKLFSGQETENINLDIGEKLTMSIDIQVVSGEMKISLTNPNGEVVWEENLNDTASYTKNIQASDSGNYLLVIEGIETEGSFDIKW